MAQQKPKPRMEKFEATRPNGTVVIVERNIDTGEQTVTEKKAPIEGAADSTPADTPAPDSE